MSPFPAAVRPKIGLVGAAALVTGLAVAGPLTPPDATAATTPVAATTTTSTVPAARDTIVNKQFPTQSYGSSSVVWLSGNTQGLLAFRTPAVPAGSVATSAKLCLTPTETAKTVVDVFTAPSGWTESATWNTRPATQTTRTGSTSGTLTAGTRTCVAVPVSQLEAGETQFRLASTTLVEKMASRETGSTGPTLSVTYTSSTSSPTTSTPTAAPTTSTPTAAPTTSTPTAAPTTATPTAAPTTTTPPPTTDPAPLTDTTDFLTTSLSTVQKLPMSGSGWTTLLNTANGSMGSVDLSNQDNISAGRVLAAALVYGRTGQTSYRDKVVAQLKNVNASTLPNARVLSVGRQMAGYAMAAALVDYREPGFVSFMSGMRTRYIGNHGRWVNLTQTSEDTANNWGAWAMSSRIALDAYVGDRTDLARAAKVFRGFLGDRSAYAGFTHTGEFDSTWVCGSAASWVPINPAGCGDKSGAVVEDISRSGGSYPSVDDTGRTYSWETLGGAMLSAQVLRTHGYPDVFSWSDKALLRAAQFEQSHGGYKPLYTINQYIPWSVNNAYGVNLGPISSTAGFGRQFGFTDWLS